MHMYTCYRILCICLFMRTGKLHSVPQCFLRAFAHVQTKLSMKIAEGINVQAPITDQGTFLNSPYKCRKKKKRNA